MVQAAEYRYRHDVAAGRLRGTVRSGSRYLLVQSLVRSGNVEVSLDVLPENASQVSLTQDYDMVEAFSAHRPQEAFTDGIQIGRT